MRETCPNWWPRWRLTVFNFIWARISKVSVHLSIHSFVQLLAKLLKHMSSYSISYPPLGECFNAEKKLTCPISFLSHPRMSQKREKKMFIKYGGAISCWKTHWKEISKRPKNFDLSQPLPVLPKNLTWTQNDFRWFKFLLKWRRVLMFY